jgi:transposase
LDKLAENKEWIEKELFDKNHLKIGQTVDVVFYDVTTFAFQSFQVDEIRNFGFSKDCKFNEVQVVMGLLIDNEGMPIGYELFPGNTFDGKTMVASLENIKKKFSINRVVIVADRGLNSKNNLNLIRDAGYGYIVASKIRSMGREIKEQILNNEGYTDVGEGFCYKVMEYENVFKDENKVVHRLEEHLIVSYSEKRALKDKSDRERLINKANKLLAHPASIEELFQTRGKKYLKNEGQKRCHEA